jgi:hypothetical protein
MSKEFNLWLEFEEGEPDGWDIHNGFCHIRVELPDARHYSINVWTFEYLQTAIKHIS